MKRIMMIGAMSLLLALCCALPASAADATVAMDMNSAYVWRGITFNDGFVLQPSVDVVHGGFGVNVWGNIDMDDYDDTLDSGEFSEVDITLSYGFDVDPVSVTIGYIEYLFPTTDAGGAAGTRELFLSLGFDLIGDLSGSVDVYYDFDEFDTVYVNAGLGYSFALSEAASLDLGASAGYYDEDGTADGDAGLFDYLLSAGVSYAVSDALSIAALLNYTDAFDEDKLPDGMGAQDVNTFGGLSIAYSF